MAKQAVQFKQEIDQISRRLVEAEDLDPLLDLIAEARCVLLGEATHGTSEYYLWRSVLSRRLIEEKGFSFIAVEGDWPDCYRLNRFVKNYPDAGDSAREVLHAFERWPTWMWANWEVVALAEWLQRFNAAHPGRRGGFYGLDVYSLWESMQAILRYLERVDPQAASTAQQAYRCFEPYGEDVQGYAWSTRMVPEDCEDEVIDLLVQMQQRASRYDGDPEAGFNAEQNSRVIVNAEQYYRAMVRSDRSSWNIRDEHMVETFQRLLDFHDPGSKGIVWAHNTHVGDARYTDMARAGMLNIGQLIRQQNEGDGAVLVGFGSHQGTVIAGQEWGAPMEEMRVPPAAPGSWEDLLHRTGEGDRLLLLEPARESENLMQPRGHRAIGVVYQPEYESRGNYVPTVLPQRYDAFAYLEETHALHPLHITPDPTQPPETYPWTV